MNSKSSTHMTDSIRIIYNKSNKKEVHQWLQKSLRDFPKQTKGYKEEDTDKEPLPFLCVDDESIKEQIENSSMVDKISKLLGVSVLGTAKIFVDSGVNEDEEVNTFEFISGDDDRMDLLGSEMENLMGPFSVHFNGATPVRMVKKIKENPPNAQIALPFFQFCLVAATCKSSDDLMAYKEHHFSNKSYHKAQDDYLFGNFAYGEKLSLNQLTLIGNLLMSYVCIPDSFEYDRDASKKHLLC